MEPESARKKDINHGPIIAEPPGGPGRVAWGNSCLLMTLVVFILRND